MSAADVQSPPAPALPDYLSNPNAVLNDAATWRYGKPPDYSNTRKVFQQTKKNTHEASSLPSLVENLVKNWEIEASFKSQLSDWRTVDLSNYSFAINGGPPQTGEHMLEVGTYNAIIAPNEFYSPANSDFASSHKTFKRMMPTFAWEVVEVYSGPPQVAFKWRHWGQMKNDYVGFNDKGEKITAQAHGGTIDIEGVTVAQVDDKVRLQKVETWFDPLEMFRQIAPNGIVNKEVKPVAQVDPLNGGKAEDVADSLAKARPPKESLVKEIAKETHSGPKLQDDQEAKLDAKIEALVNAALEPIVDARVQAIIDAKVKAVVDAKLEAIFTSEKRANLEQNVKTKVTPLAAEGINNPSENTAVEAEDGTEASPVRDKLETLEPLKKDSTGLPNDESTTLSKDKTQSTAGNALAAAPDSEETRQVHEEMSKISAAECPFLMNKE